MGGGHFQAGVLRHFLDRIDEGQPALIGHPADRIAVRAAAEAMIKRLVVVDVERRRLFVVERAAALEFAARLLELDRFRDQRGQQRAGRSEEHTSELQSLMRISYSVFCLKKKKKHHNTR